MRASLLQMRKFQRGMSVFGMMFVLMIVGFIATVAVKLGPLYMDNRTVNSALEDIKTTYAGADIAEVPDSIIKGKLSKYFQVNLVSNEIEKSVKIVREKQRVTLSVNYEIRNNFMGNVDLVVVFKNEVELGK